MPQLWEMPDILRDSGDSTPAGIAEAAAFRRQKRRLWRMTLLPWVLLLVAIVAILTVQRTRHSIPLLTSESLVTARSRWKAASISDYELRMKTQTTELGASTVHVVVRGGKVTELDVDGEPGRSHEPSLYTVEGLFEVLQMELAESRPAPESREQSLRSIVRAQFDPRSGVPMRYLRLTPGTNHSAEWHVVKWEKLHGSNAESTPSTSPS